MNKTKLYLPFLFAMGLFLFNACSDDSADPEPSVEDPVENKNTYTTHVEPILGATCALSGCHTQGAAIGSLVSYEDAKLFAVGKLLASIKHEAGASPMPKNAAKLDDKLIAAIEKWIADGMLE